MNVRLSATQKKTVIDNTSSIALIMQDILLRENKMGRAQEHFWIVGFNNRNKILFIELVALGRHNRAVVNPPEVFRMAIYKLAVKAVFVHNHPLGDLNPSVPDIDLTDHLAKAGEFLKVPVEDHIVISETGHFSFKDKGIMREIMNRPTWRLVKKETEAMDNMRREIEKEKSKREGAREIAKRMKAKGMPDADIKEMTGLTLSVIKRL